MSRAPDLEHILKQASERETGFDWVGAAELYREALDLLSGRDLSRTGEIYDSLAFSLYRAAMQGRNIDEFRAKMGEAGAIYEKAEEAYRSLSEHARDPKALRCEAMIAYTGFWLSSDVHQKKKCLEQCWRLTKDALKGFREAAKDSEFGNTYSGLCSAVNHMFDLEWSFEARGKIIKEAMEFGEQTITLLTPRGEPRQLAKAFVETAVYSCIFGYYWTPEVEEKQSYLQKSLDQWQKASELSKETALLELLSMYDENLDWNVDQMIVYYEEALNLAKKTKDRFLTGAALDWLAYASYWKAYEIDDPTERLEMAERALRYAENANSEFSSIGFASQRDGVLWTGSPYAEYYLDSARWALTSAERRDLLEKAVKDGTDAVKLAEATGYPDIVMHTHHVLSLALGSLAQLELNSQERKRLLEAALNHRNESVRIIEQLQPFSYWNRGAMLNFLADLKAEVSSLEKNPEARTSTLEEAVASKQQCLQMCAKEIPYFDKKDKLPILSVFGRFQYSYGTLLTRLSELSDKKEYRRTAITAFENAARSFQKPELHSRVAECYWKVARIYDSLDEHAKADENFNLASRNYTSAAEKIDKLKDFYNGQALYMEAWSEIEKARDCHEAQEYGSAKEHFEKAAVIHKSLEQWNYLAPNYLAWAKIENAEDLSRKEKSHEAIKTFREALELFLETKRSLQAELSQIEDADEKDMISRILEATELRREYCAGRIALEEGRILGMKGDHYSSSEKYASAAETFEKLSRSGESEQDRNEFRIMMTLSRAWQRMMRAEAEESADLYTEAAQLFEEVKELIPNEKAKMLAMGHSRFCRALEAGTRFADTRDPALHATASQHLETTSNYYSRAGLPGASKYAKATELLLDAYMHMDTARKEDNLGRKAKLLTMTERVLELSATSFIEAGYTDKKEQVERLLENVREKRELAVSFDEILKAPAVVSATTAFSTPTPTHESAVGLERFEHADIQANVIASNDILTIGDSLKLEIELVNVGKGPAMLTRIVNVLPEGFEMAEKPEAYRVEDSCLNMRGKRLDPLETEEVRLTLLPKAKGAFHLRPRILYLDENGVEKSHESELINIRVRELGIKGWLRGER